MIGKTGCYDWIIASHVIEHVPNFISYLQQCEAMLKPDGILSFIIPDKRYCFDYFSSSSSTGDVLEDLYRLSYFKVWRGAGVVEGVASKIRWIKG